MTGRIVGVDPGRVRVGLAVSDPQGSIAMPSEVIEGGEAALEEIVAFVIEKDAVEVVVGLPVKMSGEEGPEAGQARELARRLQARLGLPVHLVDERLTTVSAHAAMKSGGVKGRMRRRSVDKLAAALILQTFLDKRKAS